MAFDGLLTITQPLGTWQPSLVHHYSDNITSQSYKNKFIWYRRSNGPILLCSIVIHAYLCHPYCHLLCYYALLLSIVSRVALSFSLYCSLAQVLEATLVHEFNIFFAILNGTCIFSLSVSDFVLTGESF